MRLRVSLFGREVFAISTDADVYEDEGADLSGGYLTSSPLEVGRTDVTMGFTLGLDDE